MTAIESVKRETDGRVRVPRLRPQAVNDDPKVMASRLRIIYDLIQKERDHFLAREELRQAQLKFEALGGTLPVLLGPIGLAGTVQDRFVREAMLFATNEQIALALWGRAGDTELNRVSQIIRRVKKLMERADAAWRDA